MISSLTRNLVNVYEYLSGLSCALGWQTAFFAFFGLTTVFERSCPRAQAKLLSFIT